MRRQNALRVRFGERQVLRRLGSGTGVAEGPVVLWTNNGGTGEVSTRFNPEKPWKNHGFKGGNLPKMMMKYLDGKKLWGTENHEKHMIATPGTIFRT